MSNINNKLPRSLAARCTNTFALFGARICPRTSGIWRVEESQVREVVRMLEENIANMSHIRHTLKVLETRVTEQMFAATLDESGFEDFDPDNNGD